MVDYSKLAQDHIAKQNAERDAEKAKAAKAQEERSAILAKVNRIVLGVLKPELEKAESGLRANGFDFAFKLEMREQDAVGAMINVGQRGRWLVAAHKFDVGPDSFRIMRVPVQHGTPLTLPRDLPPKATDVTKDCGLTGKELLDADVVGKVIEAVLAWLR
jgi:hypothetical protein